MVVAEGVTIIPVPLVTVMSPGVITPAPLAKTPVNVAVPPALIEVGLAVKLVMVGDAGFDGVTATVVVIVAGTPAEFVTVRV